MKDSTRHDHSMKPRCRAGLGLLLAAIAIGAAQAQEGAAAEEPPANNTGSPSGGDDFDELFLEEPAPAEEEPKPAAGTAPTAESAPATPAPEQAAEPEPYAETIPVAGKPEPETPAAEPRAPKGRAIEEIVVTARKRAESVQDTPVVVSALSGEQLERYNVSDMTKIAEMTPQLFVSSGSNGNGGTINMRGIGSSSTTSGFDQAVSINLDGIQYSRGNVLHQGYFDIGQVEVLKGPQSLFFGKSSSAGVISLSSADPGDEREFKFKTGHEFEARDQFAEVVWSGPVGEDVGLRAAARYSRNRGYIENLAPATTDLASGSGIPAPERDWPGEQQGMGRVTLTWAPSDAFDAKLKLFYVDLENGGPSQGTELIDCRATGSSQINSGQECRPDWKVAQNDLPSDVASTESLWNERDGEMYSLYRSWSAAGTLNYNADWFTLTSVTGYYLLDTQYLGDFDFTASPLIAASEHPHETALSQELRLLSEFDGPLNAMVGGYYQQKDFQFDSVVRLLPLPRDPSTGRYTTWDRASETDGRAWSAFAQLIWKPTDTLEMNAGARYSDERKDSFSVHRYVHPLALALFKSPGERLTARTHDTDVSPEVSIAWRPGDYMLYAAYKKGFKSGGYSNSAILSRSTVPADATFKPETAAGYEAGIKSTLLDGSLQVNFAAYSYEFQDLQVNFFDASTINFMTQNAATATTRGAEMDFRWLPPIEGLDIHGNLSYNRAVYGDFLSFCYSGQSYEAGCNLDENGQPAATTGDHQDLSGTVRPIAPKFTGGLGLLYRFGIYGDLMLTLTGDTGYVGSYLLNSLGRQIYQSSYFRSDASISVGPENGRWELSLVGRNLSNEYLVYDAGDSPLTGQGTGQHEPLNVPADQLSVVGRPREIGLQFSMRFGAE